MQHTDATNPLGYCTHTAMPLNDSATNIVNDGIRTHGLPQQAQSTAVGLSQSTAERSLTP